MGRVQWDELGLDLARWLSGVARFGQAHGLVTMKEDVEAKMKAAVQRVRKSYAPQVRLVDADGWMMDG